MMADFGLGIADSQGRDQSAIRKPQSAIVWDIRVEPEGKPGAENMAGDLALLDAAERSGRPSLRLYRWDPPCLSFGRNEAVADVYDLAAIARRAITTVRRPTGGRAVWHEHELTYAVAAPIAVFGSLRRAYLEIHARLAVALQSLGVPVTLAASPGPARPRALDRAAACFAEPAGGEILARGRKLVGSAQVRRRRALLQHGSILLDGSQEMASAVSRRPAGGGGEITLAALLARPVPFEEVAGAIVAAWRHP